MSEFRGSFGDVPSDVALFDIEQRAHAGTATAEDALSLFAVISEANRRTAEAEADKAEAEERANGYASEAEDLREKLERAESELEDYQDGRTPRRAPAEEAKSALEALEIWKSRAERAEAELAKRAHRKGAAK